MIISSIGFRKFNFPCGEIKILLDTDPPTGSSVDITWEFSNLSEIFELALLKETIDHHFSSDVFLNVPYMPFGREDRRAADGGSFSLKVFANFINSFRAKPVSPYNNLWGGHSVGGCAAESMRV